MSSQKASTYIGGWHAVMSDAGRSHTHSKEVFEIFYVYACDKAIHAVRTAR